MKKIVFFLSYNMSNLPLKDLKVLEFTHAVMGPCTGLILADLGAEVIHVEPPIGDHTRRLKGFGSGYYTFFNRNKKSLALDIKSEEGQKIIYELAKNSDIIVENFGPGTMDRLGFGYDKMNMLNEKLIYCSLKGFMPGPYEKRHAMDEVVQMMGGLAYMTGRSGQPLRAGTSVIDITGGMFGVIGIITAVLERHKTGRGTFVQSSLFETTAFLMGQHMAYGAITQTKVPPMPERVSAWSIYRIFDTADKIPLFIGIISEKHWQRFCETLHREDWLQDSRLISNSDRIDNRDWFLPEVEKCLMKYNFHELESKMSEADIPFARIATPEDLFTDHHLNESRFLLESKLPDGRTTKLPKTPILFGDVELNLRGEAPEIGEHTDEILRDLGMSDADLRKLKNSNFGS
jgi:crotonobetainyl-CoA:carnitine CoA-transferase CaiB-like acyl-CoA transferase